MSEEIAKVPAIRFKGFNDPWEQCKLKEVLNEFTVKSKIENEHTVLSSTNAGMEKRNGRVSGGSNKGYKIISNGDLVLSPQNLWLGNININEIGKGLVSPSYKTFKIVNLHSDFLKPQLRQKKMLDKYKNASTQGASIVRRNLDIEDFNEISIDVPFEAEQVKIGSFFKQLDNLITLQQRELDLMKKQKKTLLSKMFPKTGEQFPEIRFKGFTDPWEQCKLKDVTKRVQGNDGRMDLPTLTISAGNGWMNQVDRFSGNIAGNEQKNYTLLKKGQLSYNHGNSKLAKYGAVFELRNYEEALVPRVYHSFEMTEGSAGFIDYMFSTKLPDRELGKLVSSGARMDGLLNINYDDFSNITIRIPSPVEQDQITSFLRQFDQAITLQQRKLDQMKIIKKSLLKAMFV